MRMIAGCSNYAVDAKGNVFNTKTGKKLKHAYQGQNKYAQVKLITDKGKCESFYVRRLVSMSYCNAKSGCTVVILKRKFRSNKPSQAERFNWGTRKDSRVKRERRAGKLKGKESQILKYRLRGWTQVRIANKFGVSQGAISHFLKRNGVL